MTRSVRILMFQSVVRDAFFVMAPPYRSGQIYVPYGTCICHDFIGRSVGR